MSILARLPKWFERRPLILLSFEDGFEAALRDSKRGVNRFTIVKPHGYFDDLKLPTLCLAEMPEGRARHCYVGVVTSKAAVATFDSRLTLIKLQSLRLLSFASLHTKLGGRTFQTALKRKLSKHDFARSLSPKLSVSILDALLQDSENRKAIEDAAFHIPRIRKISISEWEQSDAVKMAIAAFGLGKSALPELVDVPIGSDSTLDHLDARVLEDNVIARDASAIPDFSLIEKHVTGHAVFENSNERLDVYTANRGPLEEMLGVDLIYVNEVVGNTVMVQYKMLTPARDATAVGTDWIFRPDDQLKKEVARMKLPSIEGRIDDYRLNRGPFFFKFVKRKGDGQSHQSFVISLDHLNQVLDATASKGPKGGVRVSYDALDGAYLRESDLIGLIRSGYIGTHRIESLGLNPIIAEVAKGNRALVLAWQRRLRRGES
jgi:hypothetical protein